MRNARFQIVELDSTLRFTELIPGGTPETSSTRCEQNSGPHALEATPRHPQAAHDATNVGGDLGVRLKPDVGCYCACSTSQAYHHSGICWVYCFILCCFAAIPLGSKYNGRICRATYNSQRLAQAGYRERHNHDIVAAQSRAA